MKTDRKNPSQLGHLALVLLLSEASPAVASGPFRETCESQSRAVDSEIARLRACVRDAPDWVNPSGIESPPSVCKPQLSAWLAAERKLRQCQTDSLLQPIGEKK